MYRQTSRQRSLLDPTCSLPIEARTRLEASWGQGFQQQVYPLLLSIEDSFGDLYAEDGRPNWSVARMLGVVLLQEMLDLPDQKALDQLSFDLRWHRALDLAAGDAYLSRRSLVAFRSRLVAADPEAKRLRAVFTAVAKEAVEAMKLSAPGLHPHHFQHPHPGASGPVLLHFAGVHANADPTVPERARAPA